MEWGRRLAVEARRKGRGAEQEMRGVGRTRPAGKAMEEMHRKEDSKSRTQKIRRR